MKRKVLLWLIGFTSTAVVLVGILYGFVTAKDNSVKYKDVESEKSDVPYESSLPDNKGIILNLPDNCGLEFYLDFENREITVNCFEDEISRDEFERLYGMDYHIDANFELISGIVDRVGGINYNENGENLRLTGIDAVEKIKENSENKKVILEAVLDAISENGLNKNDMIYIISNCESTDFSIIDCFYWEKYIKEMCSNMKRFG